MTTNLLATEVSAKTSRLLFYLWRCISTCPNRIEWKLTCRSGSRGIDGATNLGAVAHRVAQPSVDGRLAPASTASRQLHRAWKGPGRDLAIQR